MKNILTILVIFFAVSCKKEEVQPGPLKSKLSLNASLSSINGPTKPDHIIFVWFENKGYNNIIGSSSAPYINSLIPKGTLFTNSYGLTHPSYPNYVSFFAGGTQGVTNNDCIDGTPKTATTLYNALASKGVDFRWYSEGLPSIGSRVCSYGYYREKHNPTTIFSQVPPEKNRPFSLLDAALKDPTRFANIVPASCVTPNMINDMHDGTIQQGDTWLKTHFEKFINWALLNNSIVVVYFDESSSTSPDNRIPVIMVGQHIKANYKVTTRHDHYSFTRLISTLFGASTTWTTNVSNATVPVGFWK